jgi:serine/threonine-protein kinase HipA
LSPAYGMNPSIDRRELTLAINEVETACDVSIAMDASKEYGLTPQEAGDVHKQVQAAVSGWQQEANRLRIPEAEQSLMAAAFQV